MKARTFFRLSFWKSHLMRACVFNAAQWGIGGKCRRGFSIYPCTITFHRISFGQVNQSFVLLLSQLPFLADIWHGSQSVAGSQPKSRKVVRHQWRRINESWKKTDRSALEKPMIWQTFRYFTTDEKALFEASMERLRKFKLRGIIY